MLRRTPLKRVSDKYKAELAIYRKLRAEYLRNHTRCEFVGCKQKAIDIHHKEKRGKNLNAVLTWCGLCRDHHKFIEDHKSWARHNGYLK